MKKLKAYISTDYHFDKKTMCAIFSALWAISGIYGFIYEVIFYYFNSSMKHFYWRGGCFGPWIVIYGLGAILIYLVAYRFKKKPFLVFLLSGLSCGIIEFLTGVAFYYLMDGKRNWNYNTEILNFGNIGGFVCLRSVLVFAVSGVLLIYLIIPALFYLAKKMNKKAFFCVSYILGGAFLIDVIYNTIIVKFFPSLFNAISFYQSLGFNFMHF